MKIQIDSAVGKDVPPEHLEAYSEMCRQFALAALNAFQEMRHITIMREMPMPLQINAFTVGVITGSLTPLMMLVKHSSDAEIAAHMAAAMPAIVQQARMMADDCKDSGL